MSSLAILLVNPTAGSYCGSDLDRVIKVIQRRGLKTEVLFSRERGDIRRFAAESKSMSPEMVFVLGGDGTFNEAANGLAHSEVPLVFLPLGTTNVLAYELSIPLKPESAAEKALSSKPRAISLGKTSGNEQPRYFILMAGAGFDAYAVFRAGALKKRFGKAAYILSGLSIMARYNPAPMEIRSREINCTGFAAIIGKASRYGGRFRLTPDASLFEPCLYAFILKSPGRYPVFRTALKLAGSKHLRAADVEYFRTEALSLTGDAHLQIDGDYAGKLPVEISVERECLNILY